MNQVIQAIYTSHKKAARAALLLGEKGYYNKLINNEVATDPSIKTIISGGMSGAYLGGAIGIILGYMLAVSSGFSATSFGSQLSTAFGLPGFLGTIIFSGILGGVGGSLLGSFITFGIIEDNVIDKSYQNDQKIVSIPINQKTVHKLLRILKQTEATRIKLVNPLYTSSSIQWDGIKGGRSKKVKK